MSMMPSVTGAAEVFDRTLANLVVAADRFDEPARDTGDGPVHFHAVAAAVHTLCTWIATAESEGLDQEAIRGALAPAWNIHGRSPFIRRLQTWPRGYPGDFETIEYLLDQGIRAQPDTIEYWLEFIALHSPIAQQHRNKVRAQAREIISAVQRDDLDRPARVLVLASGSSPDLALAQHELRRTACEIVLNDSDAQALAFSLERLTDIRDKIRPVAGNVLSSVMRLRAFGPYDLVLAGGLFDYLPDRHATFLIRAIWNDLLAPDGRLFLTNIANPNPYRVWIEYLADWRLIERSADELRGLVAAACGPDVDCELTRESCGLTWMLTLDRSD